MLQLDKMNNGSDVPVQLKTKDLKNVRRLAQEVLLQRSDVEIFFVSSLKHIREQLEREGGTPVHKAVSKQRAVDIAQLSWSERETVLRLAFAKINNQFRQVSLMNLPTHSFTATMNTSLQAKEEEAALRGLTSDAGPTQLV